MHCLAAVVYLVESPKSEVTEQVVEVVAGTPACSEKGSVLECWMTLMMVTNQSDFGLPLGNHIRRRVSMFALGEEGEGEGKEKTAQRKHRAQNPTKKGPRTANQKRHRGRRGSEQAQQEGNPKNPEGGQEERGEGEERSSCPSLPCYKLKVSAEQTCLPKQLHNESSNRLVEVHALSLAALVRAKTC